MKDLKDYIKESILGNWEDIDVTKDIKSEIKQFLKDNYKGRFSITLVGSKYIVDSKTSVIVKNKKVTSLTNGMFEFGKVGRDFNCGYCYSLTSLEGAPEIVGEDFYCSRCDSLSSLKGAPKEVSGDFSCYNCHSLTSLEGAPEIVGGNFWCCDCNSLKTLKGAPVKVGEDFYCSDCKGQFTEKDVTDVCDVKGKINI